MGISSKKPTLRQDKKDLGDLKDMGPGEIEEDK